MPKHEPIYFASSNPDESAPPLLDENWHRVPSSNPDGEPFYRYRGFADIVGRSYGYIRDVATRVDYGPRLQRYVIHDQGLPYIRFDARKLFEEDEKND